MATGDYVGTLTATDGTAATVTAQPGTNTQWEIHTLYHDTTFDLKVTDGGSTVTIDAFSGTGSVEGCKYELTNGHYLELVNTTGSAAVIGYRGVET